MDGAFGLQMIIRWANKVSNREPMTAEGNQERALQKAKAAASGDCFVVPMKSSTVNGSFNKTIPIDWVRENLPEETHEIKLRIEGTTWYTNPYRRPNGCVCLTTGWKKFVLDNYLELSDVCMFKPTSKTSEAIVLDVSIFKGVEAETSLAPVIPVHPKRKRSPRYPIEELD